MRRRLGALAARLAALARLAGPLARHREKAAGAAIAMPAGHPGRITSELGRAEEEWLAAVCAPVVARR